MVLKNICKQTQLDPQPPPTKQRSAEGLPEDVMHVGSNYDIQRSEAILMFMFFLVFGLIFMKGVYTIVLAVHVGHELFLNSGSHTVLALIPTHTSLYINTHVSCI